MADDIRTLDVTLFAGQQFISNPALFGSKILYLAIDGVGLIQLNGSVASTEREFSFKASGLFAYKPLFFSTSDTARKVHVIYKL